MMKALVIEKDFSYSLKDVPIPTFGEYQALVKIEASAVCGTDLKILHGEFSSLPDYPTILGHEAVGIVVEVGAKVKNFSVGERVLHPILYEETGGYYSTFGAMAEYAVVEDYEAIKSDGVPVDDVVNHEHFEVGLIQFKIPQQFEPVSATMIITFTEVFSTFKRANLKKGQSLVVYGLGPVGQVLISLCRLVGMKSIVVVRRAEKAQLAEQLGADIVIDSSLVDPVQEVHRHLPDGVDAIWDAAGVTDVINIGLKMIKPFGKIIMYGVMADTSYLIDWKGAPLSFDLIFTQWPDIGDIVDCFDEIIEMMSDNRLNGMDFISDIMPFDRAVEGIDMFLERRNKQKIVFTFP